MARTDARDGLYCIDPAAPLDAELRRIARAEIARSRAALGDADRDEGLHRARQRFKKLRGLLRLVRPALGEAGRFEDRRWRDAARRLSQARDATAMIEAADALRRRFDDRRSAPVLRHVCAVLAERRDAIRNESEDFDAPLAATLADLEAGAAAEDALPWPQEAAALADGYADNYRRARRGFAKAAADADPEHWHDWRKRVKYHWMHVRLLEAADPKAMKPRRDKAKRLADLLGDDHDLTVLQVLLEGEAKLYGRKAAHVLELMDHRRREMRAAALQLGGELFEARPKEMARRLIGAWPAVEQAAPRAAAPRRRRASRAAAVG